MSQAYFDCFSGISGDMTLGALVDAGADPNHIRTELSKLNLNGYRLEFTSVKKHGISGTKAIVIIEEHQNSHHHGRHLSDIRRLIYESKLSDEVKIKSDQIFTRLAEAEAKVHNTSLEEVHFHEVGAVDSIIDIIGSVIGLSLLDIKRISCSPLPLGSGFVRTSHGVMPVPAPATVQLLKGIPIRTTDIEGELVTPTGAAIISTLASEFGPIPNMVLSKVGYGAGTRDIEKQPNMLRILIGEGAYETDIINIIETNIDDMSPQAYDLIMDKLFKLGALDVYLTPIHMKKNRPAIKLSVLIEPYKLNEVCTYVLKDTTTMGVRIFEARREKLSREISEVDTEYGKVKVKIGKIGDEVVKVIPEYDDCKRISIERDIPLMKVYETVSKAFKGHL